MTNGMLAAFTGTEIMWIAIVLLVLFGAQKVPQLMKGVGQGIKEFKKASRDVQDEVQRAIDESDTASSNSGGGPSQKGHEAPAAGTKHV